MGLQEPTIGLSNLQPGKRSELLLSSQLAMHNQKHLEGYADAFEEQTENFIVKGGSFEVLDPRLVTPVYRHRRRLAPTRSAHYKHFLLKSLIG